MKKPALQSILCLLVIFSSACAMGPNQGITPDDTPPPHKKQKILKDTPQLTSKEIIRRIKKIFRNKQLENLDRVNKEKAIISELNKLIELSDVDDIRDALLSLQSPHSLSTPELIKNNKELHFSCFLQSHILDDVLTNITRYSTLIPQGQSLPLTYDDFLCNIIIEVFPRLIKHLFQREEDFYVRTTAQMSIFSILFNPNQPLREGAIHELFQHHLLKKNPFATEEKEVRRKELISNLLNFQDGRGNTSLHYATQRGKFHEIVSKLIGQGAKTTIININNESLFHHVAQQESVSMLFKNTNREIYGDEIIEEQENYLSMLQDLLKNTAPDNLKNILSQPTNATPLEYTLHNKYGSPSMDSLLINHTLSSNPQNNNPSFCNKLINITLEKMKKALQSQSNIFQLHTFNQHPLSIPRRYLLTFNQLLGKIDNAITQENTAIFYTIIQGHLPQAIKLCFNYSLVNVIKLLKKNDGIWNEINSLKESSKQWKTIWKKTIKEQNLEMLDFLIDNKTTPLQSLEKNINRALESKNPIIIKKVFSFALAQGENCNQTVVDLLDDKINLSAESWNQLSKKDQEFYMNIAIISGNPNTFTKLFTLFLPEEKSLTDLEYRHQLLKTFSFCLECNNFQAAEKIIIKHPNLKQIPLASDIFSCFYLKQPNDFLNQTTQAWIKQFSNYFSSSKKVDTDELCSVCFDSLTEQPFISCISKTPHFIHLDCYREQAQSKNIPNGCGICRKQVESNKFYTTSEYNQVKENLAAQQALETIKKEFINKENFFSNQVFPHLVSKPAAPCPAMSLRWTQDNHILLGFTNNTINKWNADTLELVNSTQVNFPDLFHLLSDGNKLLSVTKNQSLQINDCLNDKSESIIPHYHNTNQEEIMYLNTSPQEDLILATSNDCHLKIWDRKTGNLILSFFNEDNQLISCSSITPDNKKVIIGSSSTIKIIDILNNAGSILGTIDNSDEHVTALAISPDNTTLFANSENNTIAAWSIETQERLYELSGHKERITSLTLSPDSKMLISTSDDSSVKIWNLENKQLLQSISFDCSPLLTLFSPNGKNFISVNENGNLYIWKSFDKSILYTLSPEQVYFISRFNNNLHKQKTSNLFDQILFNSLPAHIQRAIESTKSI